MITSRNGQELTPETAVFSADGPTIGMIAIRKSDNARRYYELRHLRADGGDDEIYGALWRLVYVQEDSSEFQEALER